MKRLLIFLFIISFNGFSQVTLTPNESFFSPKGTLNLYGESIVNDEYNNNKNYERIGNWRNINDTIVWGIKNLNKGELNIELFSGISTEENNSEISIFLNDLRKDLVVKSTSSLQDFQSQGVVTFNVPEDDNYEIKIKIKTQNSNWINFGEINKLVLSGSSLDGKTSVWKRRWRPLAIHGTFISDDDISTEISVMEINILSKYYDSYQTMTTEFGYIGSPIEEWFSSLTGLNFSLWSYDANETAPPHYELSHLISVGGEGAYFGKYGHEGTGVKPRGFDPFEGKNASEFIVALRKKPGIIHNTFWCYFFDTNSQSWKFFGAGKKFNENQNIEYLKQTGGFLEVVGPPNNSRTGHRKRSIEYRGWRMKNDTSWNAFNKLEPAYTNTDLSFKEWKQNQSGNKFLYSMGGFQETGPNPGDIILTNPSDIPFYLKGEYLEQLYVMPADFYTIIPEVISSTKAIIKFKINNLGSNPEIKLFYGEEYGLTEGIMEDRKIDETWEIEENVPLNLIVQDTLNITLDNLNPNSNYYYRLRIKNDEGITWSYDADTISTFDTDGDGVTDDVDQCPSTPNGETVDANGCSDSQKDTDGDGVTDDLDQCPNTPTGETVDANGCPLPLFVENISFVKKVYPNPTDNELIVELKNNSKVEKVEFVDFSGKIITPNKVELNNSLIRINVSNIIEGIYLLNITTDKEVNKVKVVIER